MLVCLLALRLVRHRVSLWRVLIMTFLISTCVMPLQVFYAGFWLSYGAVAALVGYFIRGAQLPVLFRLSAGANGVAQAGYCWCCWRSSLLSMPANFLTVPIVTL